MAVDLKGRVAVVTGAGVRVGRAVAEALGARGAAVLVHFHESRAGADEAVRAIERAGSRAVAVQGDLTRPDDVRRVFAEAAKLGGCDLLVNSAATFERLPLGEIDDEKWRRMLDTNLSAPFYCCREAAQQMQAKGRGDIVNLVDLIGVRPFRNYAHHASAKAGLKMLTEVLALELAPKVRVNAIAPGTVLFPESYTDAQRQKVLDRIPLQRSGTPEDVVRALDYLLGADFVTGQTLLLDGGRHLA